MTLAEFDVVVKGFYRDPQGNWQRGELTVRLSEIRQCWKLKACRIYRSGGTTVACGTRHIRREMDKRGLFECHTLFETLYSNRY